MGMIRSAVAWVLVATIASGCAGPKVVRVFDGQPSVGRFIPYEAYAWYARAAEAEARGDRLAAAKLYEGAAEQDPSSPEIWTRLGAARCSEPSTRAAAWEAFERAEELDASYAPIHLEQARCASSEGRVSEALGHATRALALDPERDEIVLLYASLLERAGRVVDAERALDELVIERPTSVAGWLARYELAMRRSDRESATRAGQELSRRAPRLAERLAAELPTAFTPLATVDAALTKGDLDEARKAARKAHLPAPELAVRAAAIGAADVARSQAELVLGADPSSSSARIALAVAADLAGDTTALASALTLPSDTRVVEPSPLARLIFAELLARRVSRDAARAFVGTDKATPPLNGADPLLDAVRRRLHASLASS